MSVPSPCIGVCQLNDAKVCQGCHRSIDEIALWSSMTNAQRQRTLDRIGNSQQACGGQECDRQACSPSDD